MATLTVKGNLGTSLRKERHRMWLQCYSIRVEPESVILWQILENARTIFTEKYSSRILSSAARLGYGTEFLVSHKLEPVHNEFGTALAQLLL